MQESKILAIANEICRPHNLEASFLGDESHKSVGVGGDCRTWTRIIVLRGLSPEHEVLANISNAISNRTTINRITFDVTTPTIPPAIQAP